MFEQDDERCLALGLQGCIVLPRVEGSRPPQCMHGSTDSAAAPPGPIHFALMSSTARVHVGIVVTNLAAHALPCAAAGSLVITDAKWTADRLTLFCHSFCIGICMTSLVFQDCILVASVYTEVQG
jgi:hypothetical protein